jgi:flagellar hook protein FlgE
MFTAISALKINQDYMDVVANNLANANTPAYKASRVTFQDQFSELVQTGQAPTGNRGGLNPTQIGLGTRMGTVTPLFTQGMLNATNRNSDLALEGEGFFVYSDGAARYYARDGGIEMDSAGYLVNGATGYRVLGWDTSGSPTGPVDTGQPLSELHIPLGNSMARETTSISLSGNLYSLSETSGSPSYTVTVGAYDTLGALHTFAVTFTQQAAPASDMWDWAVSGTLQPGDVGAFAGAGTIQFDADGQFIPGTYIVTTPITIPASPGATTSALTLDMTDITMLTASNTVASTFQDGLAAGNVSGFYILQNTGEIYAYYSNGLKNRVGQIAVALFSNPSGLERIGQNLYLQGLNSGEPAIGAADTGGRGFVAPGYLEASNVDLGREFTNMILAERGFQASSRVITTSDEMLQELVNLKR